MKSGVQLWKLRKRYKLPPACLNAMKSGVQLGGRMDISLLPSGLNAMKSGVQLLLSGKRNDIEIAEFECDEERSVFNVEN